MALYQVRLCFRQATVGWEASISRERKNNMIEAITAQQVLDSYRRLAIRWRTDKPIDTSSARQRTKDAAAEKTDRE
jgi:hypothetical protein